MGDHRPARVPREGLRARRPPPQGPRRHRLLRRAARTHPRHPGLREALHQKVRDVFAATSVDYDKLSGTARAFFATIQNKLIYAVTGRTAAELVVRRCDPAAPNLGLTTWAGGRVRKGDVDIAKNYLTESEVSELNRLTTMFLDFADDRARRRQSTTMVDWVTGSGSVSAATMKEVATERYGEFDERRRAQEAELAAQQEWDDLRELTAIEHDHPADPDEDEP